LVGKQPVVHSISLHLVVCIRQSGVSEMSMDVTTWGQGTLNVELVTRSTQSGTMSLQQQLDVGHHTQFAALLTYKYMWNLCHVMLQYYIQYIYLIEYDVIIK